MLIGITQEAQQALGREVVVERQSTAVGQFIATAVQSCTFHQGFLLTLGVECLSRMGAVGGYLIVHGLGIEVVTIFHHAQQYLVYRGFVLTQQDGVLVNLTFPDGDILQHDIIA